MEPVHLSAHFDGANIVLDEPFSLEQNIKINVTVLDERLPTEHENWIKLSKKRLEAAFGDQEPEYGLDSHRVANPDQEGP